jgi:PQQ-dependent catabolism-associated CXXCW motif protein
VGTPWLPSPHRAIPGSLWLPGSGFAKLSPTEEQAMRQQVDAATGKDLERTVVVYCHERCWFSWNAAKRIIGFGYRHVMWLPGGIEVWQAAEYPTQVIQATPILDPTAPSH